MYCCPGRPDLVNMPRSPRPGQHADRYLVDFGWCGDRAEVRCYPYPGIESTQGQIDLVEICYCGDSKKGRRVAALYPAPLARIDSQ